MSEDERLESWKEIASFLGRSVRTVRRWEAEESLPVHRHRHGRGSTVFAFTDELNQWREQRAGSEARDVTESPTNDRYRWTLLAIGLTAAFTAGWFARGAIKFREPLPAIRSAESRKLVARATTLLENGEGSAARELLVEALREEPQLAIAHGLLAHALEKTDAEEQGALAASTRAFELSVSAPLRERLFIGAEFHRLRQEWGEALAAYEALIEIEPNNALALAGAVEVCGPVWSSARCSSLPHQLAGSRPNHFYANASAAWALAVDAGQLEEAEPYANRALELTTPEVAERFPKAAARMTLFSASASWVEGNLGRVVEAARFAETQYDQGSGRFREDLAVGLGYLNMTLGRYDEAQSWFDRIQNPEERHERTAHLLFARGALAQLADHLETGPSYREPMTAFLAAMTGAAKPTSSSQAAELFEGHQGLMSGQLDTAIDALSPLVETSRRGEAIHFAASDFLAQAHSMRGETERGLSILEMHRRDRIRAAFVHTGVFWLRCQLRLSELYRGVDRVADARTIEAELRMLTELSDESHPIRLELERRAD